MAEARDPWTVIEQAQNIILDYLPPDSGVTEHEAMNRLIGLFDDAELKRPDEPG